MRNRGESSLPSAKMFASGKIFPLQRPLAKWARIDARRIRIAPTVTQFIISFEGNAETNKRRIFCTTVRSAASAGHTRLFCYQPDLYGPEKVARHVFGINILTGTKMIAISPRFLVIAVLSSAFAFAMAPDVKAQNAIDRLQKRINRIKARGKGFRDMLNSQGQEQKENDPESAEQDDPSQTNANSSRRRPAPTPAYGKQGSRKKSPTPVKKQTQDKLPPRPVTKTAQSGIGLQVKPEKDGGLKVIKVAKGSPADEAGIRSRDILIELAGLPMRRNSDLNDLTGSLRPGDQIIAKIERSKKEQELLLEIPGGDRTNDAQNVNSVLAPGPIPESGEFDPRLRSVLADRSASSARSSQELLDLQMQVNSLRNTIAQQNELIRQLRTQLDQEAGDSSVSSDVYDDAPVLEPLK